VVQLHHFYECWEVAKATPGIFRKLRVFLDLSPAYNWRVLNYNAIQTNTLPPPPTLESSESEKLRLTMPNSAMRRYGVVQFVVILAEIMISVVAGRKLSSIFERLALVAHLVLAMYSLCTCFDCLHYAAYLESARCLVTIGVVAYFARPLPATTYFAAVGAAAMFNLACAVWTLTYQRSAPRATKEKLT